MRAMRTVMVVVCLVGCAGESPPDEERLVMTRLQPNAAIEASYSDGGRTLALRATLVAGRVAGDLVDERGNSLGELAAAILERRTPAGDARPLTVAQLLESRARLADALRLATPALRRLHEKLPPEMARSPLYAGLAESLMPLQRALTLTRRQLLAAWGAEAARELALSAEERARLGAILMRHSHELELAPPESVGGAADADMAIDTDVAVMLGAQRFSRYARHRVAWLGGVQ